MIRFVAPVGTLRFNILGSFAVFDGDRQVGLGGLRQRCVLAVLVLAANRVVPFHRLIDDLYGEHPPAQATNAVQTHVSNLRRAMEPDRAPREPARVLRSQPPGYLLAVDPDDVDAVYFERLAREGRALLGQGDLPAARDALAQALRLWRGPALAEFVDQPFAGPEAARLEELRVVALENRIAADLALGEHAAVIGELQHLVVAEPSREALWKHLIVALYRAGRQGDALAAYRECRQILDEQLGLEPSPTLRQLEVDVLQQAPSLDWRAPDDARVVVLAGHGETREPPAIEGPALIYRDGAGRVRERALRRTSSPLTVGREEGVGLPLSWDPRVSRTHARLESEGDGWVLVDDGPSRNGSFVNDELVQGRRELVDGDVLRFGDTTVTFRRPTPAEVLETLYA